MKELIRRNRMKNVTRRDFIVSSAMITAGTISTFALGSSIPRKVHAAKAEFPESSCGLENGRRVLVTYASHCGSTAGVAESIGKVLCNGGATVDIRRVKSVKDLTPYKAVVVGSAIHSSRWLPEAVEFVETNQKILNQIPVAYFLTCLTLYKSNDKTRRIARSYINPVLEAFPNVRPVDIGLFAGVLDYSKLSFVVRMVMKSKMKKKGVPEGDHRDWGAIRSWAEGLRQKLPYT
jgi:menaquinone-dependent protoporphyrinogen oxidase